jgi:hypothetical protein
MPDSLYLAPNQSQPGGNRASIAKQCGGVATHGTLQPGKGRAAAIGIRLADLFRGFVCSLARWSGRSEEPPERGPRNAASVDLTVECLNAGVARGSAHSYMIYHKHVKSILLRLAASC